MRCPSGSLSVVLVFVSGRGVFVVGKVYAAKRFPCTGGRSGCRHVERSKDQQ